MIPESITFTDYFKQNPEAFDAVIFDIDGTLASGKIPLPGAKELLEYLNSTGFPYLLLTNDACTSTLRKAGYLNKGGLPVDHKKIISAGTALKFWAEKENHTGKTFLQCGIISSEFTQAAHIALTENVTPSCSGVIVGEGGLSSAETVFNFLLKKTEVPLLVANPDSYWPSFRTPGEFGIGAGATARFICQLLKDAGMKKSPVYLGKPYSPIYECLFSCLRELFPQKSFNTPARIVMLGDSLTSDIAGANRNGLCSALVMTGITGYEQLPQIPEIQRPDLIFSGV